MAIRNWNVRWLKKEKCLKSFDSPFLNAFESSCLWITHCFLFRESKSTSFALIRSNRRFLDVLCWERCEETQNGLLAKWAADRSFEGWNRSRTWFPRHKRRFLAMGWSNGAVSFKASCEATEPQMVQSVSEIELFRWESCVANEFVAMDVEYETNWIGRLWSIFSSICWSSKSLCWIPQMPFFGNWMICKDCRPARQFTLELRNGNNPVFELATIPTCLRQKWRSAHSFRWYRDGSDRTWSILPWDLKATENLVVFNTQTSLSSVCLILYQRPVRNEPERTKSTDLKEKTCNNGFERFVPTISEPKMQIEHRSFIAVSCLMRFRNPNSLSVLSLILWLDTLSVLCWSGCFESAWLSRTKREQPESMCIIHHENGISSIGTQNGTNHRLLNFSKIRTRILWNPSATQIDLPFQLNKPNSTNRILHVSRHRAIRCWPRQTAQQRYPYLEEEPQHWRVIIIRTTKGTNLTLKSLELEEESRFDETDPEISIDNDNGIREKGIAVIPDCLVEPNR